MIFADIFSNEYQSGFIMIMSISKNGGKKTFNSKYLFGFITITAIYILFTAIDLFFLFRNFNMDYLNTGIMAIPEFAKLEMNVSILEYFILFKVISYIGFVMPSLIIISLSAIMKNVLQSTLMTMFILFVPLFLGYFDVNILSFINITNILSPVFITEYIVQYIFCFILVLVLVIKSRFNWIKR